MQFIPERMSSKEMAKLVLVRHGISEYNAKGLWTGWDDPSVTEEGLKGIDNAAESLKDITFHYGFTPDQKRSIETLSEIRKVLGQTTFPIFQSKSIKERNYGVYTKKNKWQVKEEVGEEEFQRIRRGWDHPLPKGESLKKVSERTIPFYRKNILLKLKENLNVIIVSSGNALRTLVKFLENISDEEIASLEFGIGEAYVYEINENGKVVSKEIRNKNPLAGKQ